MLTVKIVSSRPAAISTIPIEVTSTLILIVTIIIVSTISSVVVIVHILWSSTIEIVHVTLTAILYRLLKSLLLLRTLIKATPV